MSKKHLDEYFKQVCNQYELMKSNLDELTTEANNGMVSPEQLENMKTLIQPILNNYHTISWIMYLLNRPNREEKVKKYQQMNKKLLNKLDKDKSYEMILKKNDETIMKLKDVFKNE